MVVRREVAEIYCDFMDSGVIRTTGRASGSLIGADDTQIVWLAEKAGHTISQVSGLKTNHLITAGKANFRYLKRLGYGGGVSWLQARYEIFPEERDPPEAVGNHLRRLVKRLLKQSAYNFYKPREVYMIISGQLGVAISIYTEYGQKPPRSLSRLIKVLGLE